MGLGSTAKKLQRVTDLAEEVYERLADLRDQIAALRNTVDETSDRVAAIETELDGQRALLEAVAREQGLDPEEILDEADGGETGVDATEDVADSTPATEEAS